MTGLADILALLPMLGVVLLLADLCFRLGRHRKAWFVALFYLLVLGGELARLLVLAAAGCGR